MLYEIGSWRSGKEIPAALVPLTPSQSKRLIAKAVAALPEVQRAKERGRIIIANGSTNAYVAEELLGGPISKYGFVTGGIRDGGFYTNRPEMPALVIRDGQIVDMSAREAIEEFELGDVFIKGANAVDAQGNVGILLANRRGGTIAYALGIVAARGSHFIAPVGLEKLVPSVIEASRRCGQGRWRYCPGNKLGMMPLVGAKVITEIQAIHILWGLHATHIASGGINGMEGAVTLALEGREEDVAQAYGALEEIMKEPPLRGS